MNRRISFNPTSVLALRTPRPASLQTRAFGNTGNLGRVGLKGLKYNRLKGVRSESTQIGENESGHITAGTNEGILFLDNIFPIKLGWLLRIPWYGRKESGLSDILYRFNNKVFSTYDPLSLVKRAIPSSAPLKVTEILPRLKEGGAFVKFVHDHTITAKEIEGLISKSLKENPIKPWFNPFRQMRAKLVLGKPWLEDLYRFPSTRIRVEFVPCTPGGEVAELSQETILQPVPQIWNCLHGLKVTEESGGGKAGTTLRLSFEAKMQAHHVREWLTSHPRFVIPAVAAIVATITVAVFDPIRTFFIKAHIDHAFSLKDNKIYAYCKPIQEARGDSATIAAAAATVGYRPVFSWMNSISSLIDLAAQGTIGVKSGFSETLDSQLAKIWQNTATALKQVALQNRKKDDKDASLADDDWLEAHPEYRPVVVIDNFLHKNEESSIVYDKISEWAAGLTTSNIAHVIFLTNDISYSKSLSKALPDRVFRQISLGDITPQVAKRKTEKLSEAQRREDLSELDECIEVLGGRLTDLEFLARRLKTGQTPKRAVAEIVEQSASEIMKMYLLSAENGDRKWSVEQAWYW
ncbi:hypothetical protein DID88_008333 [Monilinia fructigena]|uniref:Mitochondrial escape protein 2 n=1 Tax=Monilinia fructigena TaxID=38457 RepID=A0A395J615_9HELO|nr:hypothetical protein DID88_008333 [Monilinia fructigena]